MALSKTKLKKEIEGVEAALDALAETIKKCEDGILVNNIVLESFRKQLEI